MYHLGDIWIGGKIILKIDPKKIWREGVDWINLAPDKVQWLDQVKTVINL
jgi:hypothetical protein